MGGGLWKTDLIAGLGATALLLLGVFVLGLGPLLSVGLALLTYLGLRLVLPKPDRADEENAALEATLARCREKVTEIGQFAGWAEFAGKPPVEEQLLRIARVAGRILDAIGQDPNKRQAAEPYLTEYLVPITDVLAQYVRLAGRKLALAQAELTEIETQTLPLIERRLTRLYEQIHSADVASLELNTKMLEYTLQPIDIKSPTTAAIDDVTPEEGPPAPRESSQGHAPKEAAR